MSELEVPRSVKVSTDNYKSRYGRVFAYTNLFAERCPAGKYYDDEAGLCRSCGHGFFQPNEGSFKCLLCGLGKTTRTTEAVSQEVSAGEIRNKFC